MVVVDTSVWIDYLAGRVTREAVLLDRAVEQVGRVAVCGPVLQELLQGIRREKEYKKTRLQMSKYPFLEVTRWTFLRAAGLYHRMRGKGFTAGRFDVLIAAVCLEHDAALLTSDRRGFEPLARLAGLRLQ